MYKLNKLRLFAALGIFILAGCRDHASRHKTTASFKSVTDTAFQSSSPYLTRDATGTPVLSWVQKNKEGKTQVFFAGYVDSLKRFGRPVPIPPSRGVSTHGEDMPKLIFDPQGNALLVFAVKNPTPGNPYTGAIYYTWSRDGGKSWTPALPLADDTAESYDQRYFDIARLADGKIGMTWLSNSKPAGSTLLFSTAEENGRFAAKTTLASHTCQCCRTALLVDDHGTIHVAWRNIFPGELRDMAYCYSVDEGKTFSAPVRISPDEWKIDGCPHTGPALTANKEGLHVSWFTMGNGQGIFYCHSESRPGSFSVKKPVSELPSARHPQMATMSNGNIVLVWDEGIPADTSRHQHIGLQLRGPSGKVLTNGFLTPQTGFATFPQIELLNKQEAIVAYTERKNTQTAVRYQIIQL